MNGSTRIVHALAPAPFGGIESVVEMLATSQIERGHKVRVVAILGPDPKPHAFVQRLGELGVECVPVRVPRRRYDLERASFRDALQDWGATVVHTHGYQADVVDSPVARKLGIPTVTTVHGYTGGGMKNRIYEWIHARSIRSFGAIVAVSEKLRSELVHLGVPGDRTFTVRNAWRAALEPIDPAKARDDLGLPRDVPVVGWVGRMSREKAPDVMLDVMGNLGGDVHLSMIGTGPMEASLRETVERRGMADRCHWHGVVPAAARYLRAFDAIAITSWTEGTPMALLEAMSAGVPVVSTRVGGIPDVISESEAWLADAGSVDGLAAGLEAALSDSSEVAARTDAARVRLDEDFAVEAWVRRYDDIYAAAEAAAR